MELKAYICPQCGGSLHVENGMVNVYCPHCGTQIHISYQNETAPQNETVFSTPDGLPVASAVIPNGYLTEAMVLQEWQSEFVPLKAVIRAVSPDERIVLGSISKELYYDIHSVGIKTILSLLQTHTKNGYTSFVDPDEFQKTWTEQITGLSLTPLAKASLPSLFGVHPQLADEQLQRELQTYFRYLELTMPIENKLCDSVLYRYSGVLNGTNVIVLSGCDYVGAELGGSKLLGQFSSAVGKVLQSSGAAETVSDFKKTFSDVISGKQKMTMADWMHGGILGVMKRNSAEKSQTDSKLIAQVTVNPDGSFPFGHSAEHGKGISFILFGALRRYSAIFPADAEASVTNIFLRFVSSLKPDSHLAQQESMIIQQKFAALQQEVSQKQALAHQKQMQTIQMQQQTSRMIARNNAQTSAGIMDSWNKRMDSQSRISNNYSEAIRGVNSYVTPSGNTVEASAVADHVYQNQYGDTIGVSGNAVDTDIAAKLNWTELEKK